ncbi:MAG: tRNA (N6-threonylcarbamoyladenosine(37)-N6)-methyltransferase TrmO [Promethearchaeota archaeon]
MMELKKIGVVENSVQKSIDPFKFKNVISTIIIEDEFKEGLLNLDKNEFVQVVFYFHKSPPIKKLVGVSYYGTTDGVFANRSPVRPNPIGITTVKLLKIEGNKIFVEGLDAINGTPVLDIKPHVPGLDEGITEKNTENPDVFNLKRDIWPLIRNDDYEALLHQAAKLHGHYCKALALGVMMGARAMKILGAFGHSDGMENVLAIVEMNHCAVDGIQHVTGCTFGNNALIFKDIGKTAMTLAKRKGDTCKGIRIALKPIPWEQIAGNDPEIEELFEKVVKKREGTSEEKNKLKKLSIKKSISVVKSKFEDLFKIEKVEFPSPSWAPIFDNVQCAGCGEFVMKSRAILNDDGKTWSCYTCAHHPFNEVAGRGIHKIDDF